MKKGKIENYHFEEIILILLILASELSRYDEDDLDSFSENIEGRIEVLFKRDFLTSINNSYGINDNIILELEKLRNLVVKNYEAEWVKKLQLSNQENNLIRQNALKILNKLKVKYVDPKIFSEEHLNIDW